ncbi:MAG TPA: PLP-dependent aspartate aminotransferase family protein [Gemmatimonadales bacterium]|nr:PLP-dependent aspartate aminotransferase family protein [Gemmatimonadales bacterium]
MTRALPDDHSDDARGFATRAIHAGQTPDPLAGAAMPPIYQTSTYVQQGIGRNKGYEYGRTQNPTREALERNVASLEGGEFGFAFASGLAALDAVLKLLKAGDHVVSGESIYGGSMRLMTRVFAQLGLEFTFVDTRDVGAIERALTPRTRMVFCETPTNPMMFLADLSAIGDLTQAHGILYVVDNTFATPYFQRPLEHGADVVLHSTTKYLNGHSDMVGGLLVTRREDLAERLGFIQNASGAVPGPFDCWLALRGIKTLPLRMRQHDANGRAIAAWLETRPDVPKVNYPGFGGMLSFDVGDVGRARRLVESTRIFALAESLGGVESLIGHPASMTHASVPLPIREAMGLTDSLIRLSCGCEDTDDLIADLAQALDASARSAAQTGSRPAEQTPGREPARHA